MEGLRASHRPAVSVVVATRNRAALLPRLVAALESQQGAPPFEVVFVEDGSTDGTAAVLAGLAASSQPTIRICRLDENRGPAAARNIGWRTAAGSLVVFTDDDCHPQPDWLAALAAGLEHHDIAQGRTIPNPTQDRDGVFSHAPQALYEGGFYETCNIGYRRTALEAVAGFDESFAPRRRSTPSARYVPPVWGEDTDLAWRAKAAGARSTFVPEAVVWHDLRGGRLRDRLAELPRRRTNAFLVKRHPGVRANFESPYFIERAHRPALGAALALLFAAQRPRRPVRWLIAGTLFGAWARIRVRNYPRRRWPQVLPQWFLVDVADVAVMAVASIRNGALLL